MEQTIQYTNAVSGVLSAQIVNALVRACKGDIRLVADIYSSLRAMWQKADYEQIQAFLTEVIEILSITPHPYYQYICNHPDYQEVMIDEILNDLGEALE